MTKSGPVTSTGITRAPRSASALQTPRPEASETSRSEPGPPISTAIVFPFRLMILPGFALRFPVRCRAARAPTPLILSINSSTSAAVALPSLTMKFPCTLETRAPPTRVSLRPSSSTSFPAGQAARDF